ncbi:hypothetical protein [Pedobacter sp. KLB.chiD]|uniref:hypothetical protein n=1 Tax=Pedobacter sp. KLB.chiD TaxID=3387402 RepID=UPI00399B8CBE
MAETREDIIRRVIRAGQDEGLLRDIEIMPRSGDILKFTALIEVLVLLIEFSDYRDTAAKILIDKIIRNNTFNENINILERSNAFISVFKSKVPPPCLNTSVFIRNILLVIARSKNDIEARMFEDFLPYQRFLEINEEFLYNYLSVNILSTDGMRLFYSCVDDIVDNNVLLSLNARKAIKNKLTEKESLIFYLRNFIRPYWSSSNQISEEDFWYVPEPFFEQIFGNRNAFLMFLADQRLENDELKLATEIKYIVSALNDYKPPYFDIRYYRVNTSFHENLREIDRVKFRNH